MDVLFLVVDSLRAHPFSDGRVAHTPFLESLVERSLRFVRAYATECWTLPSHASMFTGLMPSEHGAHFHTMAYRSSAPTLAQRLGDLGYECESVTRNFVFDGTIPGITRGFARRTSISNEAAGWDPTPLLLALAKPRLRRHVVRTGFFPALGRSDRRFIESFARALRPADNRLLAYLAARIRELRARNQRFFLFANLYDVHAPYAATPTSLVRPWRSFEAACENLVAPYALSRLGQHRYLQRGFALPERIRSMLEERYRRSVALSDQALESFFARLDADSLLDDTLVILTSDHGEGFGEHGLFLHDASLYQTHLHVPLWILTPGGARGIVDDVVSMRHIYGSVLGMLDGGPAGTILDAEYRARHPIAYAQHFHYPRVRNPLPIYRMDQFAAIAHSRKLLVRGARSQLFELDEDRAELRPADIDFRSGIRAVMSGQCAGGCADAAAEAAVKYAASATAG